MAYQAEFFYAPTRNIAPPRITIDGEEFVHLTHVMRKTVTDTLVVVDGCGTVYEAVIERVEKGSAACRVTSQARMINESARGVTLAVGILKHGANFDFLVEKATEVGVSTIVPLLTERTIPRHARTDRWRKLALAAMKQSRRCVLPDVRALTTFGQFVRSLPPETLKVIPHEKIDRPLLRDAVTGSPRETVIAIGPEGGFTDEEVALARSLGFTAVSLGTRRLRTETAAIAAAAAVLL